MPVSFFLSQADQVDAAPGAHLFSLDHDNANEIRDSFGDCKCVLDVLAGHLGGNFVANSGGGSIGKWC